MYKFEEDGLVQIEDFVPLRCDECERIIGAFVPDSMGYYETFLCVECYDKKRQENNG